MKIKIYLKREKMNKCDTNIKTEKVFLFFEKVDFRLLLGLLRSIASFRVATAPGTEGFFLKKKAYMSVLILNGIYLQAMS
jgi:hypothetical protein